MNTESLFRNNPLGIIYQNLEGKIIDANKAAEKVLGLSIAQMQGKESVCFVCEFKKEDGTDLSEEEHPAMVALRSGKPINNNILGILNKDTKAFVWVKMNAVPEYRKGEDKPYQVYTILEDITERKHVNEAKKEIETQFRDLFNHISDGIVIHDMDLKIIEVNESICKKLEYTRDELLTMAVNQIDEPKPAEVQIKIKNDIITKGFAQFEVVHLTKGSKKIPQEIHSRIIKFKGEDCILSVCHDISERKKAEEVQKCISWTYKPPTLNCRKAKKDTGF